MTNKDNIETTAVIESIDVEERYWLDKLSGELKKSNFPYDNNKAVSGLYTKSLKFRFDNDIYEKLNKLSNDSYPRLHIILITGLTILLNKYTNNNDIILGTSIYNQDVEADFINTILILRNKIKEDTLFKELLLQVRGIATEAEENQNYPVDTILQKLKIPYAKGDTFPLFDVLILLENIQDASYIQDIKSNVVFSFFKDDNYLEGTVNYNSSLYEEKTILRIISNYQEIFRKAFTDLNIPVADLDILSVDERKQILYDFNNTKADYPKDKTIHELFEDQVLKTPGNTSLEYKEDKLSYEILNSRSNQVAKHLQKIGVNTNSIVGIMLENSFDLITGILGILKAGAAYLPIDILYPQKRKEFIISDSKLDILLSNDKLIKDNEKNLQNTSIENLLNINDLLDDEENCDKPESTAKPSDISYLIYTSGSTGNPKGTAIKHQGLTNYIYWATQMYDVPSRMNFPLYSSVSFDLTVTSIYTPLVTGNKIIIYNETNINETLEKIFQNEQIGVVKLTPAHLSILDNLKIVNSSVRKLIVGGDQLTVSVAGKIHEKFEGIELYNEYGPTEAAVGCMIYKYNPELDKGINVPIGKPISNVSIYLLDNQLKPLCDGVSGELFIGGDGLALGYINNPGLSKNKFINNPFIEGESLYRTGDLARRLPDGNIEFMGRIDHQVKIRGFRIELGEIENFLLKHSSIKECVVIAIEGNGDKYLCAYLVIMEDFNEDEIYTYLSSSLPDYMIPSYFVQLEKLPLTSNGKINRKALPFPEIKAGDDYVAPLNETEEKLVEIWSEVLNIEKEAISVTANFFAIGGHSLKAVILASRIYDLYDVDITIREIFSYPTIKGIVNIIEASELNRLEEEIEDVDCDNIRI
jgi:amino acid adenylation domain-containing protein